MIKAKVFILSIALLFFSCDRIEKDKIGVGVPKLFRHRFYNTPLEDLAFAIDKRWTWRVKQCLKQIKKKGVDVNMREPYYGASILDLTLSKCYHRRNPNKEIITLLLDNGVRVNNLLNCDTVDTEYTRKRLKLLPHEYFESSVFGVFNVLWGEEYLHLEILQLLIERGLDVNTNCEKSCNSLLVSASRSGKIEIVKMLVEAGVDINYECISSPFRSYMGVVSPLSAALTSRHYDIVMYYIKDLGVDITNGSITKQEILRTLKEFDNPNSPKLIEQAEEKRLNLLKYLEEYY